LYSSSHIAFTDQGLNDSSTKIPYAQQVDFATPDVVFGKFYRPGFTTYPLGDAVDAVRIFHDVVRLRASGKNPKNRTIRTKSIDES
jgi:hypothetical protein